MTGYPDSNPKTAIGATKVPLHLVPPSASHHLALAFKDGAAKYGPYNWRDHKVSASVYVSAAKRHIDAWWDGENLSADAKVEHLAHAMACMAIILDAASVGMLNDDRPTAGAASALQATYATPQVIPHEVAKLMQRDGIVPNCDGHHATEAPMPPHLAEVLLGREDDEGDLVGENYGGSD